jgi:glutamyl-Q tRNA(Asp) synthetase
MSAPVITRFAPSPTGYLHLGHALSARAGFEAARRAGGRFLLRIEDIDATRCRREFETALQEDLRFLGLRWEGEVRRQSEHLEVYAAYLTRLEERGLLYPCFCSRAEIAAEIAQAGGAPHDLYTAPIYPGTCRRRDADERARRIAAGHPYALRLDVARAEEEAGTLEFYDETHGQVRAEPRLLGDVVLGRKEIRTSYHLAVTVDDHLQGVTLVTRGEDLYMATHIHRLLQALFGFATPRYAHHPLLLSQDGTRLAKRRGAPSLRSLRQAGHSAPEIWAMAGLPAL